MFKNIERRARDFSCPESVNEILLADHRPARRVDDYCGFFQHPKHVCGEQVVARRSQGAVDANIL